MHAEIFLQDALGAIIYGTVLNKKLRRNLEIGSWSGEGSTRCFVEAMKQLDGDKHLDCVEIIPDKYEQLKQLYADVDFVHAHKKSSISYEEMLYKDFEDVWNSPFNNIPKHVHSKELVKSWYDRDMLDIQAAESMILSSREPYDSVFIDGGEFTGYSEFALIKDKTRVLFLDDVHHAFKCYRIYAELIKDPEWICLVDAPDLRNGFAVFERKI